MAVRAVLALLLAVGLALAVSSAPALAQDIDAQALRIERQLLCPQCTNLRLDVCDTQLCADMRAEIRDRLQRGESDAQIIDSFTERYGIRVLAEVPASGFNHVLFAWVALSVALVGGVGAAVLVRQRRTAQPVANAAGEDDRWLDEELAAEGERR